MNRNLDSLGRIVIPKEIRNLLNINEGDLIEIKVIGMNIVLKKCDGKPINSKANEIDIITELNDTMGFLIDYYDEYIVRKNKGEV